MKFSPSFLQPPNMESDPPFYETYKNLFNSSTTYENTDELYQRHGYRRDDTVVEECELPLIDISPLKYGNPKEEEECKREIARASMEWGFFQVVNHGISCEILEKVKCEQMDVFKKPFDLKKSDECMKLSVGTYRWGTPSATCLKQLAWSEAFHIPLSDFSSSEGFTNSLSSTFENFAGRVSDLAQELAEILAEKLGCKSTYFQQHCLPSTCYLRMNRYPPCPISSEVYGLMPHTDSDFLTILHQDQVGGLQLVKDGRWIAVKPYPGALIINIGDLFQAWSNGVYKSVEHRVVTNQYVERFSTAYFFCPSYQSVIESCIKPSVYRKFSFKEYRQQVQDDVQNFGYKIGLPRFLV